MSYRSLVFFLIIYGGGRCLESDGIINKTRYKNVVKYAQKYVDTMVHVESMFSSIEM